MILKRSPLESVTLLVLALIVVVSVGATDYMFLDKAESSPRSVRHHIKWLVPNTPFPVVLQKQCPVSDDLKSSYAWKRLGDNLLIREGETSSSLALSYEVKNRPRSTSLNVKRYNVASHDEIGSYEPIRISPSGQPKDDQVDSRLDDQHRDLFTLAFFKSHELLVNRTQDEVRVTCVADFLLPNTFDEDLNNAIVAKMEKTALFKVTMNRMDYYKQKMNAAKQASLNQAQQLEKSHDDDYDFKPVEDFERERLEKERYIQSHIAYFTNEFNRVQNSMKPDENPFFMPLNQQQQQELQQQQQQQPQEQMFISMPVQQLQQDYLSMVQQQQQQKQQRRLQQQQRRLQQQQQQPKQQQEQQQEQQEPQQQQLLAQPQQPQLKEPITEEQRQQIKAEFNNQLNQLRRRLQEREELRLSQQREQEQYDIQQQLFQHQMYNQQHSERIRLLQQQQEQRMLQLLPPQVYTKNLRATTRARNPFFNFMSSFLYNKRSLNKRDIDFDSEEENLDDILKDETAGTIKYKDSPIRQVRLNYGPLTLRRPLRHGELVTCDLNLLNMDNSDLEFHSKVYALIRKDDKEEADLKWIDDLQNSTDSLGKPILDASNAKSSPSSSPSSSSSSSSSSAQNKKNQKPSEQMKKTNEINNENEANESSRTKTPIRVDINTDEALPEHIKSRLENDLFNINFNDHEIRTLSDEPERVKLSPSSLSASTSSHIKSASHILLFISFLLALFFM